MHRLPPYAPFPPPQANPGDVALKAGDVLLLDTGAGFRQRYADTPYFALVSEVDNSNPPRCVAGLQV